MFRNDTDEPIIPPDDWEPLAPHHVRLYEFLHGYEDITIEEYERRVEATKNDPLLSILHEEIEKEINAELIRRINAKSIK